MLTRLPPAGGGLGSGGSPQGCPHVARGHGASVRLSAAWHSAAPGTARGATEERAPQRIHCISPGLEWSPGPPERALTITFVVLHLESKSTEPKPLLKATHQRIPSGKSTLTPRFSCTLAVLIASVLHFQSSSPPLPPPPPAIPSVLRICFFQNNNNNKKKKVFLLLFPIDVMVDPR